MIIELSDALDSGTPPAEAAHRLIEHAARLNCSDLFFLAQAHSYRVAARHLGIPRPITSVPIDYGRRMLTHVKALANLEVAEHYHTQEGRWLYESPDGPKLDLRISLLPTLHGEDLTIRILEREDQLRDLEDLGMTHADFNILQGLLNTPGGLILATGPTGAGKTTTLYSCVRALDNGQRKIHTIEDPVEYALENIRQSQVNEKMHIGFADLLRGVLRQAPDVILVGEIRDADTATIAVRAANSGHLVLATMHAPIAAGAIQTLIQLGVHPHFLASCLLGVITQRLARTLCPRCRITVNVADHPALFQDIRSRLAPHEGYRLYAPRGCPECRSTGYSGRTGIFEVLKITAAIRQLILERQPTFVIRQKAREEGMTECRFSALHKVAQGLTSIEEIIRVIPEEYLCN